MLEKCHADLCWGRGKLCVCDKPCTNLSFNTDVSDFLQSADTQ